MAPTTVRKMDIDSEGQKSLESLQRDIKHAVIKKTENGNVQYSNRSLDATVAPLLKSLHLDHLAYAAWKIVKTITIENETGPEYIIPVETVQGDPIISIPTKDENCPEGIFTPSESLRPGSYVYHDGTVRLTAGLICLFVGKPQLKLTA
ncbi:hypothetical protein BDQ94DRAFT_131111 [Aspergillus welwitschiae]|uniref:Uncharacterized protein n=1 Tax=Aspergillus welwitschiae TaxID=1341132 RepID=A0A3F3PIH2_9EURO|nr:hypothetical protein BDQ94DRAFT_131111 [Aspergillus welwitschiae]RDH26740.1 hypothetical protein BDQ94DRAFT_131111 [Aspergillus welwitschiae]